MIKDKFKNLFGIAIIAILLFFSNGATAAAANAHRFHSSLTRIDYDGEAKSVKITIQLISHDVLEVFRKIAGKPVELENSKDIDGLFQKYIAENFILQDKNRKNLELKWVGRETDFDRIFFYLEAPIEESIEGFHISNTIFFETYPSQTNIIISTFGEEKSDLLFKLKDGFKMIEKTKKEASLISDSPHKVLDKQ